MPIFCSEMILSSSDFCSNCSEALLSCLEIASNCSDWLYSCSDWLRCCSDAAASCSDRTPLWYSRSHALDSSRSHSRRAL